MRIVTNVKLNQVKGPRLPFPPSMAETADNEYIQMTADGLAINGPAIVYWIDTIVTTDGGGSVSYDSYAASGKIVSAAYAAKAKDSVIKDYNPPKKVLNGLYVDLTTASVDICYKPLGRNLVCSLTVTYAPGTQNLVGRVTTLKQTSRDLEDRLTVLREDSLDLVSRLVSRVVSRGDVPSTVTVQLASYPKDLACQVTVVFGAGTLDLVSRVVVLKEDSQGLICQLYADRTP